MTLERRCLAVKSESYPNEPRAGTTITGSPFMARRILIIGASRTTAPPASLPFGELPHPDDVGQIVVDLDRLLFCVCLELRGVGPPQYHSIVANLDVNREALISQNLFGSHAAPASPVG